MENKNYNEFSALSSQPKFKHLGLTHTVSQFAPHVKYHFHDHYEILWFLDGNAVYSVEGNRYPLKKNDILITNMQELHAPVFFSEARYERMYISIMPQFLVDFVTEDFNPYSPFENRILGMGNLIEADKAEKLGIHDKLRRIEEYYNDIRPESEAMIKCLLLEILVSIPREEHNIKMAPKIAGILRYVNENLDSDLSFSVLEKKFFVSSFYLSRLFKKEAGFTLNEYIRRKRIIYAKELILQGTDLMIVADKAGFSDYSTFFRNFKKFTGMTPREFLKNFK